MQKREVDQAAFWVAISLPLAAWVIGTLQMQEGNAGVSGFFYAFKQFSNQKLGLVLMALGVAVAVIFYLYECCDDGFRGLPYHHWVRGSRMINWHQLKSKVKAANRKTHREWRRRYKPKHGVKTISPVMIGPMPMPIHLENRNTLIAASIGAGKSVAIESMIASALKRGDRMLIVDPNGSFFAKFGQSGDVILNPFDTRTAGWSIFNEIEDEQDFDRVAKSIIPPQVDPRAEEWCEYTRNMLSDAVRKLRATNKASHEELVRILIREDGEHIKAFFQGTDSQGYFRDNAEKATASVQFMMNKYIRPLRMMPEGAFSLKQWASGAGSGNLYITWREDMRTAQLPLVAAWVDTVCASILSHRPEGAPRIWQFLDELESLGKLESFVPAATKGRKHGLRMVATIQDWSQLDSTYGHDGAKTLLGCFRNYVLFGASNAYNADKASQILGTQVVERMQVTRTSSGRSSVRVQSPAEPVVMDSEISNLPDLSGYVMFGEDFPIARIKVPYVDYPKRNRAIEQISMKVAPLAAAEG
ncbi:TrwB protein [Chromobacterium piscinae]|nr:TrwB protein [Chromobacterium piscinae]